MFKNLVNVVGTIGFLVILFFGRDVASYITTAADRASEAVHDRVPFDFELDRAKGMIDGLEPKISKTLRSVAREEVEITQLQKQVSTLQKRRDDEKLQLTNLRQQLRSTTTTIPVGIESATPIEAKRIAEAKFEHYKTTESTLRSLQSTLELRNEALVAAKFTLESLIQTKQQLTAEVAKLEARKRLMDATRTEYVHKEDSHLAKTRELLQRLETRMQIEERVVETEQGLFDVPTLGVDDSHDSREIEERIDDYFATGQHSTSGTTDLTTDLAQEGTAKTY